MVSSSERRRRTRLRHALSLIGDLRSYLEANPDASDVRVKCIDGEYRSEMGLLYLNDPWAMSLIIIMCKHTHPIFVSVDDMLYV